MSCGRPANWPAHVARAAAKTRKRKKGFPSGRVAWQVVEGVGARWESNAEILLASVRGWSTAWSAGVGAALRARVSSDRGGVVGGRERGSWG